MNYFGQDTCSAICSKAYHSHIYSYSPCFTHFFNFLEQRRQLSSSSFAKMVAGRGYQFCHRMVLRLEAPLTPPHGSTVEKLWLNMWRETEL